jgi:hypothetical protein
MNLTGVGEEFPNRQKADLTCWLGMEGSVDGATYSMDFRERVVARLSSVRYRGGRQPHIIGLG